MCNVTKVSVHRSVGGAFDLWSGRPGSNSFGAAFFFDKKTSISVTTVTSMITWQTTYEIMKSWNHKIMKSDKSLKSKSLSIIIIHHKIFENQNHVIIMLLKFFDVCHYHYHDFDKLSWFVRKCQNHTNPGSDVPRSVSRWNFTSFVWIRALEFLRFFKKVKSDPPLNGSVPGVGKW